MQLADLHATDPYAGFDPAPYPIDVHGWGSDAPVFRELIGQVQPRLIIEVGTWKGASAIHMARCCFLLNLVDTQIVCVDTWLGALEFWQDQGDAERYQSLRLTHGYPRVYEQFVANVVRAGHQNTIIPFPQTSQIAARWFARKGVRADLIYLDASHDEADVLADMRAYWPLLRPGGVLFGDDRLVFQDVDRALTTFTREIGRTAAADDRYWQVTK